MTTSTTADPYGLDKLFASGAIRAATEVEEQEAARPTGAPVLTAIRENLIGRPTADRWDARRFEVKKDLDPVLAMTSPLTVRTLVAQDPEGFARKAALAAKAVDRMTYASKSFTSYEVKKDGGLERGAAVAAEFRELQAAVERTLVSLEGNQVLDNAIASLRHVAGQCQFNAERIDRRIDSLTNPVELFDDARRTFEITAPDAAADLLKAELDNLRVKHGILENGDKCNLLTVSDPAYSYSVERCTEACAAIDKWAPLAGKEGMVASLFHEHDRMAAGKRLEALTKMCDEASRATRWRVPAALSPDGYGGNKADGPKWREEATRLLGLLADARALQAEALAVVVDFETRDREALGIGAARLEVASLAELAEGLPDGAVSAVSGNRDVAPSRTLDRAANPPSP